MSDEESSESLTEDFVKIGRQKIRYMKAGKGENVIICMPRALGFCDDFKNILNGMNHRMFTVYAWDIPGYGRSRPPQRKDLKPGYHARDARLAHKLMTKLGVTRYSVVGFHDGVAAALCLAYQQPKSVRKLILWGGSAVILREELEKHAVIRNINGWSEDMQQAFVKMYGPKFAQEMWMDFVDEKIRCYKEEEGNICGHLLPMIEQKTLIIHGANMLIPDDASVLLEDNLPNATLTVKEDGGHDLCWVHPTWLNDQIEKFVLGHESS